jgi:cell division protein FtsQ
MAKATAANQNKKGAKTGAKKPVARRRVQTSAQPTGAGKFFLENARTILTVAAAVLLGVLLFAGYRAATASEVFQTQKIDVSGARRASVPAIETVVKRMSARSGVWNADLDAMRKEIERLGWVKTAVVSRVLPDGLRVRVTERTPRAVIRAENGKLLWVDDEAKVLGVVLQSETAPPFALLGWNEEEAEAARKNNRERVQLYLKLLDEWQQNELAKRITAIDLSDLQSIEAFVEKDGAIVPVQIGQTDYTARLSLALDAIEGESQAGRLSQVERIIFNNRQIVIGYKNAGQASKTATANSRDSIARR